jgi:hypothetical protein
MATEPSYNPQEAANLATPAGDTTIGRTGAENQRLRQRVLRIRITDIDTGRLKVGLSVPAGLVSVALRQGARFVPGGDTAFDLAGALERDEFRAPLVIEDTQNGERVEISMD